MKPDNTPENVKITFKSGINTKECSHIYGVGLRTWQKKRKLILKTVKVCHWLSLSFFVTWCRRTSWNNVLCKGESK